MTLNNNGISHLLIPLMIVVIGVAGIGTYMLVSSSASSRKPAWPGIVIIDTNAIAKRVITKNNRSVVVTDLKVILGSRGNDVKHVTKVTIGGRKAKKVDCRPWGKDTQCDYALRVQGNAQSNAYRTKVYIENSSQYRKNGAMISEVRGYN